LGAIGGTGIGVWQIRLGNATGDARGPQDCAGSIPRPREGAARQRRHSRPAKSVRAAPAVYRPTRRELPRLAAHCGLTPRRGTGTGRQLASASVRSRRPSRTRPCRAVRRPGNCALPRGPGRRARGRPATSGRFIALARLPQSGRFRGGR
jgi:hypothetical protein